MDKISGTLVYVCIPKPVKAMEKAGLSFDTFKAKVIASHQDKITGNALEWKDLSSVSPKDAFVLIDLLKKAK